MKYSEAKKKIKDYLISVFGTTWRDSYEIKDQDDDLFLASYAPLSGHLQDVLVVILKVSKNKEGWFEAKNLIDFEKPLADIFMELALTPLEERKEEKKYMVKVWGLADNASFLVKYHGGILNIMSKGVIDISSQDGEPEYQVAFTKKEIEFLKDNIGINIDWDKAVEEYDG